MDSDPLFAQRQYCQRLVTRHKHEACAAINCLINHACSGEQLSTIAAAILDVSIRRRENKSVWRDNVVAFRRRVEG